MQTTGTASSTHTHTTAVTARVQRPVKSQAQHGTQEKQLRQPKAVNPLWRASATAPRHA